MTHGAVSVIVPCFNGAKFLREAIESAVKQTHPPGEVVVVDDGSTDGSAEVAARIDGVRVVRQTNQGVSAARNRGVRETSGEYVVYLDCDDRLLSHALKTGVGALREHPECGLAFGRSRQIRSDGSPIKVKQAPIENASYVTLLAGVHNIVPPGTAMFRRRAVEAVGGFRVGLALAEDFEFYLRVAREHPVVCHNEVIVEARQHETNVSTDNSAGLLRSIMRTLAEHERLSRNNPDHAAASRRGRDAWKAAFGPALGWDAIDRLRRRRLRAALEVTWTFLRYYPEGVPPFVTRVLARLWRRRRQYAR